ADESTDGSMSLSSSSSSSTGSEEEEERATFSHKPGSLYSSSRLLRLCKQVTGATSIREVFGALDGMGQRMKAVAKQEDRIAKLEAKDRAATVDKMLSDAKRAGKVSKPMVAHLREKGIADPKFLKGFLASLPQLVRTSEDGEMKPRIDGDGNPVGALSADEQKM